MMLYLHISSDRVTWEVCIGCWVSHLCRHKAVNYEAAVSWRHMVRCEAFDSWMSITMAIYLKKRKNFPWKWVISIRQQMMNFNNTYFCRKRFAVTNLCVPILARTGSTLSISVLKQLQLRTSITTRNNDTRRWIENALAEEIDLLSCIT